jgi:hypothetical protein
MKLNGFGCYWIGRKGLTVTAPIVSKFAIASNREK